MLAPCIVRETRPVCPLGRAHAQGSFTCRGPSSAADPGAGRSPCDPRCPGSPADWGGLGLGACYQVTKAPTGHTLPRPQGGLNNFPSFSNPVSEMSYLSHVPNLFTVLWSSAPKATSTLNFKGLERVDGGEGFQGSR